MPLATAAAALVVFTSLHRSPEEFRAKGGASVTTVELTCIPGGKVCERGSSLFFTVDAMSSPGFLVAYAQRIDDATSKKLWYFPDLEGHSPQVAAHEGTIVVSDGVRIGLEHAPGRYRIAAWVSPNPVSRQDAVTDPNNSQFLEIEVR